MVYPTIESVDNASHEQICRWWRFLDSPGVSQIGKPNFQDALDREVKIMERIANKLRAFGGFTPEISKRIEWG